MTADPTRRRFNSGERVALYLAADGQCTACGVELQPGWHSDHVTPFSAGGPTDIINGQALCPTCNLKKGSSHMQLRKWQEDGLQTFLGSNRDFLAVATPGAGKTTFAVVAAKSMMDRSEIGYLVVVVPTRHLRRQWARAAGRLGLKLDPNFVNSNAKTARDYDGVVTTYQAVASNPLVWKKLACDPRKPTLVVLDEVHHAGDDEHLSWGTALAEAFGEAHRRLMLSGTPFRTDAKPIPFLRYDAARRVLPDINYDYGMALQDQEVVRPVAFPAMDGEARWRFASEHPIVQKLSETDPSTVAPALKAALDPTKDWIPSVLKRANEELSLVREDTPDAGGLVVASDQAAAQAYAEILRRGTGEDIAIAISDEPSASKVIEDYGKGSSRWIVAVQMVSEGVDIPRIGVIVYASRIRTEMFFRQVVGRCVRKRGPEDELCARVFVPSVQPLLQFASDIERTVNHVLRDEEENTRRRQSGDGDGTGGGNPQQRAEVLGSSAAIHPFTISSGEAFGEAELLHARRLGQQAGLPPGTEPSAIVRLARLLGGAALGATGTPALIEEQTLSERKDELRQLIKRKVGHLAAKTRRPHSHVHGDLNRACNERSIDKATEDTLNRRLVLLDQWIDEVR